MCAKASIPTACLWLFVMYMYFFGLVGRTPNRTQELQKHPRQLKLQVVLIGVAWAWAPSIKEPLTNLSQL